MNTRLLGKDRLTLLFCANAVRFMIRTAPIYKAANPRDLKRKEKTSAASLSVVQENLDNKSPFSGLVFWMFCSWSQEVPCQ